MPGRRLATLLLAGAVLPATSLTATSLAAPAAGAATPPWGVPVPTTAPAGWTMATTAGFTSGSLPKGWTAYSGQPGGDPSGWWSPGHVSVAGGMLQLATYEDERGATGTSGEVSGGVGTGIARTYGYYEVRMRVDAGAGVSAAALLWPTVGWPPEIDFFEDGSTGDTRTTVTANLHYSPGDQRIHAGTQGVDVTAWHTYGVEWSPGELRYLVDGKVWATMTGAAVPDQPMSLDLQTEFGAGTSSAPTPARVTMDVAWVAVFRSS